VKHSRRKLSQVIKDRLTYGRRTPWQASNRERKSGRALTWTLRSMPAPKMGGRLIAGQRHDPGGALQRRPRWQVRRRDPLHRLEFRTSARGLIKHVRDRWSIENSWHWARDTQLREDAHRYRETNSVQTMATLRSLAMNALRLDGFWSITDGLAPGSGVAQISVSVDNIGTATAVTVPV